MLVPTTDQTNTVSLYCTLAHYYTVLLLQYYQFTYVYIDTLGVETYNLGYDTIGRMFVHIQYSMVCRGVCVTTTTATCGILLVPVVLRVRHPRANGWLQ
jgi:hypothetical protein